MDNENVEIVELLLRQDGVHIGDALLYAIREGVYRIVELLIDHPSIRCASSAAQSMSRSRVRPSVCPIDR